MLKTLEEYRQDLDELDAELVEMLEKRMGISRKIGAAKRAADIPIYQPEREELILKKVTALVKDSGNGDGVRRVYRTIFAESREIQMQIRD